MRRSLRLFLSIIVLKRFIKCLYPFDFVIVSHCTSLVLRKLNLRDLSTIEDKGDHEVKLSDSSLRVRPIDRRKFPARSAENQGSF